MNHATLMQPADHIRDVLERMLDATPRDHWFTPFAGRGNTVAWTIGHLAWAEDMTLGMLGAPQTIPNADEFAERFAWKTDPLTDPADAPPLDELLATLRTSREGLRTWFEARTADEIEAPITGDLAGWCPVVGLLPASLAHHEAMHVGQIQVFRRAAGLDPVFT